MSKRIILVHGFNVKDKGSKTTDKLRTYFIQAGYTDVVEFDYLWTGLMKVRLCNRSLAYVLAKNVAELGCIAVGHSNGCAIIQQAISEFQAPINKVVYINPALDKKAELGPQVSEAHIWHSCNDKVVWVSKWLLRHSWGEMGRVGYQGQDQRYRNYETGNQRTVDGFLDVSIGTMGHSDIFELDRLRHWGPRIIKAVTDMTPDHPRELR